MRIILLYIVAIFFYSCNQKNNSDNIDNKSVNNQGDSKQQSAITNTNINHDSVNLLKRDTSGDAEMALAMKKVKIDIQVFRNTVISGYGYDVLIDGHKYVHQPNIPAIPGNEGFETEQKARRVADLVAFKIRNNIMPPTVDVKELDSLNVR